jgi:hypothetical protein
MFYPTASPCNLFKGCYLHPLRHHLLNMDHIVNISENRISPLERHIETAQRDVKKASDVPFVRSNESAL